MIRLLFIVLLLLWLLGTLFDVVGPAIHLLLVGAILLLAASLVRQKSTS